MKDWIGKRVMYGIISIERPDDRPHLPIEHHVKIFDGILSNVEGTMIFITDVCGKGYNRVPGGLGDKWINTSSLYFSWIMIKPEQ